MSTVHVIQDHGQFIGRYNSGIPRRCAVCIELLPHNLHRFSRLPSKIPPSSNRLKLNCIVAQFCCHCFLRSDTPYQRYWQAAP
jgi:hypothetical protein